MTAAGSVVGLSLKPRTGDEPGLPKRPVSELRVTEAGIAGDYNRYRTRTLKGDPDSAVLLMTDDVLGTLRAEGWPVGPGDLGENILLGGLGYAELGPGSRVAVGDALLQVTRACDPCTELYGLPYVGSARGPAFVKTMLGRRGWYARVLREATISLGAPAGVVSAGGSR